MTLTQMISSPNYPQAREKLKVTFPLTPKPDKVDSQAPPISSNRSLVGTAFDYAYRILLSVRLKDQPAIHLTSPPLTAELALKKLTEHYAVKPDSALEIGSHSLVKNHGCLSVNKLLGHC